MDFTLKRVKGWKVDPHGVVASFLCETADGTVVKMELQPDMIMEFVLNLMNARTAAMLKEESGVPGPANPDGLLRRGSIPVRLLRRAPYPDPNFEVLQMTTEQGAIFEFQVPVEQLRKP